MSNEKDAILRTLNKMSINALEALEIDGKPAEYVLEDGKITDVGITYED
jgi:hypothetical protein